MMEIERLLLDMGARPSRRGYAQAVEVLRVLLERTEVEHLSEIYSEVAEKLHASPQQIDRNLRAVIQEMWAIGDKTLLLQLMPWCSPTCPPSNKEFRCAIAARLRTGDWTGPDPWKPKRMDGRDAARTERPGNRRTVK